MAVKLNIKKPDCSIAKQKDYLHLRKKLMKSDEMRCSRKGIYLSAIEYMKAPQKSKKDCGWEKNMQTNLK